MYADPFQLPRKKGGTLTTKLAVESLYKVFGSEPAEAMRRVEAGQRKAEIFEATGMTVGVANANFEVQEGEVFVVMGLSGSGKSTIVRMLNRLIEPTSGKVVIDGKDIVQMSQKELVETRRREISMVFQSFALMPHQTVLENTAFGLNVSGIGKEERERRALEALDAVGLKANAHSYPDELSGGMKQRVGLARALAVDPGVLLMDEAYSALDPLIRTEMQDELMRLQREQARTVVFITHDLDEAMRVGDRIAIMESGEVVQIGTPEEIVLSPADDYVRSFFHGVDVTQVFHAGDIAQQGQVTVIERAGVNVRAALDRLHQHNETFAVVHDGGGKFLGVVTTDSLQASLEQGDTTDQSDIDAAFDAAIKPVGSRMDLPEVMTFVANSPWPVPVTDDDNGQYLGTISKSALLKVLNRDEAAEEAA